MIRKAVIGGTGVYRLDGEITAREVDTSYGSVTVYIQKTAREEIAFLPRHGQEHSVPPHRINYRANIKALKQLGVEKILATAAVGSLNREFPPGCFVIPDQFIDFTKNRINTFYDGHEGVAHADMAEPYCPALISALEKRAGETGMDIRGRGTYVCVEGPRFETKAEIKFFQMMGGDMVGMTNVPEVVLARELGVCYSAIGIVTNWCNGITGQPISHREIFGIMKRGRDKLIELFIDVFGCEDYPDECHCSRGIIRL